MNIPLIRIWELADLLEKEGHQCVPPKNGKLGIAIYLDGHGISTILIPAIIRRPSIGIESVDDFFKELQQEIEQLNPGVKLLVFQDGGTIPIPGWFTDWCRQNGIKIKWVNREIEDIELKRKLTPKARDTFNDLIDEL